MTTAAQSEAKTDLIGLKHKRKLTLILQKVQKSLPLAKVWASQRRKVHYSLSCSWTPRYCFFTEEQGGGGGGSWERWLLASDHRLCSQKPQSNAERAKQLNIYPATWCSTAPFMLSVALRLQLKSAEKHSPKFSSQCPTWAVYTGADFCSGGTHFHFNHNQQQEVTLPCMSRCTFWQL